jgi:4'-phosphopantetheinyl transferase
MRSLSPDWTSPAGSLMIEEGELHVWRANLDVPDRDIQAMQSLLSPEELERSNRFFFLRDRYRFIVSHACVRSVLSRYLRIDPDQLSFEQNSFGKPAVIGVSTEMKIEYNLTHSRGFALVAATRGLQVGVDVEYIRSDFGGLNIARRFFSNAEYHVLLSLPAELQSEAFFRCWTRKEAFIKAKGKGLLFPLDEFDVTVHPEEPPALISTRADPEEAARWSLVQADPAYDYCGAVAVESSSLRTKYLDWYFDEEIPKSVEPDPRMPLA